MVRGGFLLVGGGGVRSCSSLPRLFFYVPSCLTSDNACAALTLIGVDHVTTRSFDKATATERDRHRHRHRYRGYGVEREADRQKFGDT